MGFCQVLGVALDSIFHPAAGQGRSIAWVAGFHFFGRNVPQQSRYLITLGHLSVSRRRRLETLNHQ